MGISTSMEIGLASLAIIALLFTIGSGSMIMSLFFEKDDSLIYRQPQIVQPKPVEHIAAYYEEDDLLELDEGLLDD
jgi:hypothetical protein